MRQKHLPGLQHTTPFITVAVKMRQHLHTDAVPDQRFSHQTLSLLNLQRR